MVHSNVTLVSLQSMISAPTVSISGSTCLSSFEAELDGLIKRFRFRSNLLEDSKLKFPNSRLSGEMSKKAAVRDSEKSDSTQNIKLSNLPFTFSSLSPFYNTNPSSLWNGFQRGLGNVLIGISLSVALLLGAPIQGGVIGYNMYGVAGSVGGHHSHPLCDSGDGGREEMGRRCGGEFLALITDSEDSQRITPQTFYSSCVNEERTRSAAKSATPGPTNEGNGDTSEKSRDGAIHSKGILSERPVRAVVKKNVVDRELYDTLGVEPEATASEIKKAYYVKARESHPDRNPNNAQANAEFQKIGQAYQILADEKLRAAYDTRGKSAVAGQQSLEAGAIYTMVFGSEDFEHIIGELYVATAMKMATETGNKPTELLRFRQRKRELKLAVLLAAKLDVYAVEKDSQLFKEKCTKEADELCVTPLGGSLLGLVSYVYDGRANSHMSALGHLSFTAMEMAAGVATAFSNLSYTASTLNDY
eukprot:gene33938-43844_t